MGSFSGVGNENFSFLGGNLPPSTGFPPNGRFEERAGQFIHGGGKKQDERM